MRTIPSIICSLLFVFGTSAQTVDPDKPIAVPDGTTLEHHAMMGGCTMKSEVCCERQLYTHLDFEDLQRYMANYRDHVWSKTSPYFTAERPYKENKDILCRPAMLDPDRDRFDARYLDVSIEQLENYICRLKSMRVCEGKDHPDMIRIYYLRYDTLGHPRQTGKIAYYFDSHTLGFTPLLSTDVWNDACMDPAPQQYPIWIPEPAAQPPSANHNQICPPLTCDHMDSMIKIVDCGPGRP
ncbi:MAG: hypothetical protein H6590_08850 [Flavobacteriales bacterium]|nr:hypothetical protein [Flavobacteriales bacterium]